MIQALRNTPDYAIPDEDRIDTLMMIDDNEIDQMMYKRVVRRSGLVHNLIQFTEAPLALAHLMDPDKPTPDLILLDINMPGMNGFEFLEQATTTLTDAMCPVIVMLTTSLDPQDAARAKSFGAVRDFLNKPLTTDLLEKLAELIND